MRKKIPIGTRPNYFNGQLLLEEDFQAEQKYHVDARCQHNLRLHGWGVVSGLDVSAKGEHSVFVEPGFAIDPQGHEIKLEHPESLDVSGFGPNDQVQVGLAYEEGGAGGGELGTNRRECFAIITLSQLVEERTVLILATVQLDGQGRVRGDAIEFSRTRYARSLLVPGSVRAADLHQELRTGWLRMPCCPRPLVNKPEGEDEIPPAFRVGASEALSPGSRDAGEKDKGAAGTMDIPIPPSVTKVTRFRIAGSENDGKIYCRLILGGWDREKNAHLRKVIAGDQSGDEITKAPFLRTYDIKQSALDPEYNTLSLWVRGTGRTRISLIAVEFSY
ncbi:MAG: hypothetical protein ACREXX_23175 [Gammaproteobacteria bacterium]